MKELKANLDYLKGRSAPKLECISGYGDNDSSGTHGLEPDDKKSTIGKKYKFDDVFDYTLHTTDSGKKEMRL